MYLVIRPIEPVSQSFDRGLARLKNVRYVQQAREGDLPRKANCITALRYLLKETAGIHLPHAWIGDLPYLLSLGEWRVVHVRTLKPGDLVFRGYERGVLAHIGIAVNSDMVFHCAWKRHAVLEPVDAFFQQDRSGLDRVRHLIENRDSRRYAFGY